MNPFKARMARDGMVTAAWAELGNADVAEIMVRHGWPTIVIDGEHGIGELEVWVGMARAIEAAGGEVVLRLPDGSDTTVKRAIDRGFRNFIVPMVNSAKQAQSIVDSFRYPSRGKRGYAAPIIRASDWGVRTGYALDEAHDDVVIMLQCEHVDAVANLAEIVAVPGIDAIFIGPNDLAASAGHLERMDHAEVQALLKQIEAVTAKAGMPLATIVGAGRSWADLERLGYRFAVGVNDVSMLIDSARRLAAERDGMTGPTSDAGY
ncbi:aldolase/citrate lyase family protein [Hoeflea sp. AS60]|uniref:HpcH/HpaI aldolase family protein n=1 Tax=Hoeflea sp. AS60 TaxID=3135780 RepID=UPI00316B7526